jgi:hypothetical protein
MQISYEIDELMDRINAKKAALIKESPRFFQKDGEEGESKAGGPRVASVSATPTSRVENAIPMLDIQRVAKLAQDQQEDLIYFV